MRSLRGPVALFALLVVPTAAVAGPVSVNVLLASQMVVPDPSPGPVTLPTVQPGNLVIDPGGEVLLGSVTLGPGNGPQEDTSYTATTPFSVFVKLTDTPSGDTATIRVDGRAMDVWTLENDGARWTNVFHGIHIGDTADPFRTVATLGGNNYILRVDVKNGASQADFVLSAVAANAPEPGTLALAAIALVPVGLRAVRRRKQ